MKNIGCHDDLDTQLIVVYNQLVNSLETDC